MNDRDNKTAAADAAAQAHLRPLKRLALYGLIAAVLVAAWGIYQRTQARVALTQVAQQAAIPVVDVVAPVRSQLASELLLPGNVEAFTDAPIYARTNGYLSHWYADIGAHVTAGQLLAEIDTPEVDAQVSTGSGRPREAPKRTIACHRPQRRVIRSCVSLAWSRSRTSITRRAMPTPRPRSSSRRARTCSASSRWNHSTASRHRSMASSLLARWTWAHWLHRAAPPGRSCSTWPRPGVCAPTFRFRRRTPV